MELNSYSPLVSVIIPIYNSEKYLEETLKSIYNQTYPNFQVIFVNDGSIDGSEEIIFKYFRDKFDVYLYQENKGVLRLAETLNFGLYHAVGELVTMLPSDDFWPSYRLANQVKYFKDNSIVMVHGKMLLVNEVGLPIKIAAQPPKNYFARHNYPIGSILPFLLKENFISQPTCLIRKSILLDIGGYLQPDNNPAEDYPTHLELSKFGKIVYIDDDKIYAFYRQHSNQMTKNHFPKMVESDCELIYNFFMKLPHSFKSNYELNLNYIFRIITYKLSIVPYMEAKRLFSNREYKSSFNQIVSCFKISPIKFKLRIIFFVFLNSTNIFKN